MKAFVLLLCFLGNMEALSCENAIRRIHQFASAKFGEDVGLILASQARFQIENIQSQVEETQRYQERRNSQGLANIKMRKFHNPTDSY